MPLGWPNANRAWPSFIQRGFPDAPYRNSALVVTSPLDYGAWLLEDGTEFLGEAADATWLIEGTIEPNGFWTNDQGDVWLTSDGWQWGTSDGASTINVEEDLAPRTFLSRTTVQSIANATDTAVIWTVASDDVGAWNASSNSLWKNPGGYSKMQVKFMTAWAPNATGNRVTHVNTLGGTSLESHEIGNNGITQGFDHVVTKWLSVLSGDIFFLDVWQNSGGSLNLNGQTFGGNVYAEITWLP
jgi:hypothetical protein